MTRQQTWWPILAIVALIFVVYAFAARNYRECRTAGFSVFYCATTHLLR